MTQNHFLIPLPWNQNIEVFCTGNLYNAIYSNISKYNRKYLPATITMFYDTTISKSNIDHFLLELNARINHEFNNLRDRIDNQFKQAGINISELDYLLQSNINTLPWALYYSENGGLNLTHDTDNTENDYGAAPCRAVRHHAVSWQTYPTGNRQIWLTTARAPGKVWDFGSDIGHELFHSAFAPIPLFAQSSLRTKMRKHTSDFHTHSPDTLAKMTYLYGEIVVLTLRNEFRDHPVGLAVVEDYTELIECLHLSHDLMPEFGFDGAIRFCQKYSNTRLSLDDPEVIFLTMPVLRAIRHLSSQLYSTKIPDVEMFRTY
jgi:hypothetical protein